MRNPGGRDPIALVHGGYWRARYDLHLMDALADDLAARGHAVWNIEYRRTDDPDPDVAGGGWPATYDDVCGAIRHLAAAAGVGLDTVTAVGHSAGGHLALLAGKALGLRAVLAQAPVTDLVATAELGLSRDAAVVLTGGRPAEIPAVYAAASPLAQVPLGCRQLVVHGTADDAVPHEHSVAYAAAAAAAGDAVTFRSWPGLDHFFVLDPTNPSWPDALAWLATGDPA